MLTLENIKPRVKDDNILYAPTAEERSAKQAYELFSDGRIMTTADLKDATGWCWQKANKAVRMLCQDKKIFKCVDPRNPRRYAFSTKGQLFTDRYYKAIQDGYNTVSLIAKHLGVTQASADRKLTKLLKSKAVTRHQVNLPTGGRKYVYSLT